MRNDKPGLAGLKRLRKRAAAGAGDPASDPPGRLRPTTRSSAAPARPTGRATAEDGAAPATPPGAAEPPGPALSREDRALFRRAVGAASPIKAASRAAPSAPPGAGQDIRRRRRAATGDPPGTPTPLPAAGPRDCDGLPPARASYVQSGSGPDLAKKLRQGKWPVQATLDLHGATLDEAYGRLERFLQSCLAHDIRCVRVVHGKGYGSRDGAPVLKQTTRRWLTQLASVQAYAECAEKDGGAGAVHVLLRS